MNSESTQFLLVAILFALVAGIALLMNLIKGLGIEPTSEAGFGVAALGLSMISFIEAMFGEYITAGFDKLLSTGGEAE